MTKTTNNFGTQLGRKGVYSCKVCARSTRATADEGDSELCSQCYDLAGYENMIADGHKLSPNEQAEVRQLVAQIVKLHGVPDTSAFEFLKEGTPLECGAKGLAEPKPEAKAAPGRKVADTDFYIVSGGVVLEAVMGTTRAKAEEHLKATYKVSYASLVSVRTYKGRAPVQAATATVIARKADIERLTEELKKAEEALTAATARLTASWKAIAPQMAKALKAPKTTKTPIEEQVKKAVTPTSMLSTDMRAELARVAAGTLENTPRSRVFRMHLVMRGLLEKGTMKVTKAGKAVL